MSEGEAMSPDQAIAAIAAKQHAAFSLDQTVAAGLTRAMRRTRLDKGLWVVRHRSVFAISGAPRTWRQDVVVLTLAHPTSVASHTTAGRLHAVVEEAGIHLTLPPRQHRRSRPGVAFHEANLTPRDVQVIDGIRVTKIERTLVDIAGLTSIEPALDDALQTGLTTVPKLRRYIDSHELRHNRGVGSLMRLLDDREHAHVHKALERMMRRKLKAVRIPEDRRQHPIGPYFVDFAWLDERVVVELDGLGGHFSAADFRYRMKRDRHIIQAGFTPYHYCWDEVDEGWDEVERELRIALGLRP